MELHTITPSERKNIMYKRTAKVRIYMAYTTIQDSLLENRVGLNNATSSRIVANRMSQKEPVKSMVLGIVGRVYSGELAEWSLLVQLFRCNPDTFLTIVSRRMTGLSLRVGHA
jgi:hypothetical protein